MSSSHSVTCSVVLAHLSYARTPYKETVESTQPRSMLQVQALVTRHGLDTMLISKRQPCALAGGIVPGDGELVHYRMMVDSIFGEPVTKESALDLAHSINVYPVDLDELAAISHSLHHQPISQLPLINRMASMLAPMLLAQGLNSSLDVAGVSASSFANEGQVRHFTNHLDTWMRSMLADQNLDEELASPAIDKAKRFLCVDEKAPTKSHNLR
ncbi:MAG: hypothetical protein V7693_15780 [Halopseudomonas sabulinigri]